MIQAIFYQKTKLGKSKKPLVIIVLCALCFLEVILGGLSFVVPGWYPPYLTYMGLAGSGFMAFSIIGGLAFIAGLWKMKKWSLYIYLALITFQQLFYLSIGVWTLTGLAIPLTAVAVCLYYFRKMS